MLNVFLLFLPIFFHSLIADIFPSIYFKPWIYIWFLYQFSFRLFAILSVFQIFSLNVFFSCQFWNCLFFFSKNLLLCPPPKKTSKFLDSRFPRKHHICSPYLTCLREWGSQKKPLICPFFWEKKKTPSFLYRDIFLWWLKAVYTQCNLRSNCLSVNCFATQTTEPTSSPHPHSSFYSPSSYPPLFLFIGVLKISQDEQEEIQKHSGI